MAFNLFNLIVVFCGIAMRDWELVDSDRFSFEDSDRFEEDSLCSWISEPESLCNNWRGWKKSTYSSNPNPVLNGTGGGSGALSLHPVSSTSSLGNGKSTTDSNLGFSLVEMAAKCVASFIPFEMVERVFPPVPEQLQLRIAFWSFPEHEEDIRLYSCLANGSAEEFQKGEKLFKNDSVSDILQIGKLISLKHRMINVSCQSSRRTPRSEIVMQFFSIIRISFERYGKTQHEGVSQSGCYI